MSIAWYIQSVVTGVTSALKGGLMMAHAVYFMLIHHKINLFGLTPPDTTQSIVDEILSYIFAATGFYFQFQSGFTISGSVLQVVLWPLQVAEYYIRWTVTNKRV
jgi:hypothetical protein